MTLYTLLLFVHVSAAICLFAGFGIWLCGVTMIARAARVEQVRALADLLLLVRLAVPASALLVIAAGLTLTLIAWRLETGWIVVALGSLGIIGPIGTWIIDPKVRAIAALAHTLPDGPLPAPLTEHIYDPLLRLALHSTTAMLFGIVFLMTTKPAFLGALGAMVAASLLGLASGVWLKHAWRASPAARFQRHTEDAS